MSGINIWHGQDEPIFAATLPHRCLAGANKVMAQPSKRSDGWLDVLLTDLTLHLDKLSDQIDFTLSVPELLPLI